MTKATKQQTWEERFDDMVAEYAVDFYMQNTGESFDGHWLREEHVSKMVKAELQRQREEIAEWAKQHKATGEYFSTNIEYQKIYYDGRNQALDDIIKKVGGK